MTQRCAGTDVNDERVVTVEIPVGVILWDGMGLNRKEIPSSQRTISSNNLSRDIGDAFNINRNIPKL